MHDRHDEHLVRRFHAVTFVVGLGGGMTAPFVSVMASDLGASSFVAGSAVAATAVSLLVVDLFASRAIPHLDPRRAVAAGTTLFGVGSLIAATAQTPLAVVVSRLVQGMGAALFMGASIQVAVRLAPPGRAGEAIGSYNAAWFAGISCGPLVGGLLSALAHGTSGLRVAFVGCAVVNVLSAVSAWRWLDVPASTERPQLGLPELKHLGRRSTALLVLGAVGQSVRGGLALTLLPLFADRELGLTGFGLGGIVTVLAITDVSSMRVAASISKRFGREVTLAGALGIGAAGALLVAMSPGLLEVAVACALLGVAVGTAWVLPAVMLVDVAEAAPALALFRIASDVGMASGGFLGGALVSTAGGTAAFAWAAAFLALVAIATVWLRQRSAAGRAALTTELPLPTFIGGSVMAPALDLVDTLACHQGVDVHLSAERLDFARRMHATLRPKVEALRAIPMSFLEPVIEPATSLAWLERGGQL